MDCYRGVVTGCGSPQGLEPLKGVSGLSEPFRGAVGVGELLCFFFSCWDLFFAIFFGIFWVSF